MSEITKSVIVILFIIGFFLVKKWQDNKSEKKEMELARANRKQREEYQLECENRFNSTYEQAYGSIEKASKDILLNYQRDELDISNHLYIFEPLSKLGISGKLFEFKDILGFSLIDEATNQTISHSTGEAKTSTGSMIGRGIVGGVVGGGIGAAIGATTAKHNVSLNETSFTTTHHSYIIYLNINSISSPTEKLLIGSSSEQAHNIANLFNVIIERNKGQ